MSKKPFFIEKINNFVKENPWIVFFTGLISLKEVGIWIWKILVWVCEKMMNELWSILKEVNWDWSKALSLFNLFFCFITFVIVVYLGFFRDRIYRYRFLKEARSELKFFCKELKKELELVSEEMEKIFLKNSHELSEKEQRRLENLWEYRRKLKYELGYRKKFLLVLPKI